MTGVDDDKDELGGESRRDWRISELISRDGVMHV